MRYSTNSTTGVGGRNPIKGLNHKIFYLLEEAFKNVCENKKFTTSWVKEADSIVDELNETANPTKYFKLIEYKGRLGLLRGNAPFYSFQSSKRFIPLHSKQQGKRARKYLDDRITKSFTKEEFYYCQDKSRNNLLCAMLRIKSYSPLIVTSDTSFFHS